jgi:hypothetical protein
LFFLLFLFFFSMFYIGLVFAFLLILIE